MKLNLKLYLILLTSIIASSLIFVSSVYAADDALKQHVGKTFVKVFPDLESALDLLDEKRELPESAWFGRDQESVQVDLNDLLDDVVKALDIEEVADYRDELRESRLKIKASQQSIAEYKRKRVQAEEETTLGLNKLPGFVTKEGYDQKVQYEQKKIARYKAHIRSTETDFEAYLTKAGLKLADEEFQVLLNTVNGDSFMDMKLVFETVKGLSDQLAKLTSESGEDVETAKKYFGVYTVLLRIIDRVQKQFIDDIVSKHIPKLENYMEAANRNITEAEAAIEKGGNQFVLKQNVQSNRLTLKALNLYRKYLESQYDTVVNLNALLAKDMLTADSTYNTVALAAQVVDMLKTGINNFDLLMSLDVPMMQGFQNESLRREIVELTARMRDDEF